MALDAVAWAVAIAFFAAVRYLDVTAGVPWPRVVAGVIIAVGLQWAIGALLWIYEVRNPIGSKEDALAVATSGALTTTALLTVSLAFPGGRLLPFSVPIAAGVAATGAAIGLRAVWRSLHESAVRPKTARPALILGAGSAGAQLVAQMLADPASPLTPVGLLDDDPDKRHLRIQGVRVLGDRHALAEAAEATGAEVLVIAIPSAPSSLFRTVSDSARACGLRVQVLPTLRQILDGKAVLRDLRDIEITDLLGRDPISTDLAAAAGYLTGRRVLVTGAGGSIGSELCRQVATFSPAELYLLDRDESALHALQLSLSGHGLLDTDDVILADIRDAEALRAVFERTRPHVVFHAAALKHLPMLEQYPSEAWKTNVLGTANVLEAATAVDVDVFVNISTDKAANPTSILGASKRIAERLTASTAHRTHGKYVSVRFGNVLGSRGSVLPAFTEQIRSGGPVTVTHPEVTRYFMMIPEACELVIQAAAVGRDGEALVLDMGQPVRILDVARQMIRLSGRDDVRITYTGLRNGEKLHEELFSRSEAQARTIHPLISAVPVPALPASHVRADQCWQEAQVSPPGHRTARLHLADTDAVVERPKSRVAR